MGLVKSIVWDPFPTMLKIFLVFLAAFLTIALVWKIVTSFKKKVLPQLQKEVGQKQTEIDLIQQANQAYQTAVMYAEKKDFANANAKAMVAVSLLQLVPDSPEARQKLGGQSPAEWILFIQSWQEKDLSAAASASASAAAMNALPLPFQQQALLKMRRP